MITRSKSNIKKHKNSNEAQNITTNPPTPLKKYNLCSYHDKHHSPCLFTPKLGNATEAAPPDELTAIIKDIPIEEQLLILTTKLSDENINVLTTHLKHIKENSPKLSNWHQELFISSISETLLSYFSNSIDYKSPHNSMHDCVYDILKSISDYSYQINIHIPLQIINNILTHILKDSTVLRQYDNRVDILLYRGFKLLHTILHIDTLDNKSPDMIEKFNETKEKNKNLAAKIISKILLSRYLQLNNLLDALFSFNTGIAIKEAVYNAIIQSINTKEEHTINLLFTQQDIATEFSNRQTFIARNNLSIDTNRLDQGGYGNIYEARWNQRDYIVKFYKDISTIFSAKYGMTFLTQATHPHIISYHFPIEKNNLTGYVMENAEYGNLAQYMRSTSQPELRLPPLGMQIIDGLTYIHNSGYIHGDLKPGNILVTSDDNNNRIAKITDFDTLRPIGSKRKRNLCTLAYSSPEDHTANTTYHPASDIYSFGGVVYFMKTLKNPLSHYKLGPDDDKIISCITEGLAPTSHACLISPDPISPNLRSDISSSKIYQLIQWCWKLNPNERPTHEQITVSLKELSAPALKS